MIICLEGVDCTGKTTLAKEIENYARKLGKLKGFEVVPDAETLVSTNPRKPNRISKYDLMDTLRVWALDRNKLYIMDRGPISDNVYRIFDEHRVIMDLDCCRDCFLRYGVILVHTNAVWGRELIKQRGDDNPIALARYDDLYRAYQIIMPVFNPVVFSYDFQFHNKVAFAKNMVDKVLKSRKQGGIRNG